ncbi:MAG: hypothetical protein ACH34V_03925 [Flavobacterium sp.]|uniref:hypothetical protein n=1 Tax=Flavobacterium sp. TaxID=239 RepID=UPI0037B6D843
MKKYFIILFILISIFQLIGCGFNECTFKKDNISFQFKNNRKYEVNKFFDNNTSYHYDLCYSNSEKQKECFSVFLLDKSITGDLGFVRCEIDLDPKRKIFIIKCCEGENENCYESIWMEKRIKNKYLVFTKILDNFDSNEIDFLTGKFNEIKIIEKQ